MSPPRSRLAPTLLAEAQACIRRALSAEYDPDYPANLRVVLSAHGTLISAAVHREDSATTRRLIDSFTSALARAGRA